jgi:hypothetical protein
MSDIPSVLQRIQIEGTRSLSPVSESLLQVMGGSINYMIDKTLGFTRVQFSGSTIWVCPANVNKVLLFGCGGGGGGSGQQTVSGPPGAGGSGALLIPRLLNVTPGNSYTVTIGTGGSGGSQGNPGSRGGTTVFDTLNFYGGYGGTLNLISGISYGGRGVGAWGGDYDGTNGIPGYDSLFTGGALGAGVAPAGGGGGGPFGVGGTGGSNTVAPLAGAANTGAGGGGSSSSSVGGAGGSGFIDMLTFT